MTSKGGMFIIGGARAVAEYDGTVTRLVKHRSSADVEAYRAFASCKLVRASGHIRIGNRAIWVASKGWIRPRKESSPHGSWHASRAHGFFCIAYTADGRRD